MSTLYLLIYLLVALLISYGFKRKFKFTFTIESKEHDFVSQSIQRKLKQKFIIFFEGYDETDEAVIDIRVNRFEITNISFVKVKEVIIMTITLCRPGILIGRQGNTIDALKAYMSTPELPVEIKIIESKLWS